MHSSLHKVLRIILAGSAGLSIYGIYKVLRLLYREWTSPLRVLSGPPNSSLLWGNMKEIFGAETPLTYEKWLAEYGSTITYRSFFGMRRLLTLDTKAINHILMNDKIYKKPPERQYALSRIIGHGLLVVEGDKHRQQRRIMNPAFGVAQIRELTDIFIQKSIELRDVWVAETAEGKGRIEVMSWLSRMTLDVIGQAGFNYEFNDLSSEPKSNELNNAFSAIFRAGTSKGVIPVLRNLIPALRWLPAKGDTEAKKARTTMDRIGEQLLADSKLLLNSSSNDAKSAPSRDLLSLLLRANTNADLPASQRLTDKEVLDQVPTFLVAGHETTSTATTWALYALTQSPEVQDKLREELIAVSTDTPTMDELNSLSYLDSVVREVLRLYAPVPGTLRSAAKDDVLPLSEPIRDSDGAVLLESIPVKKGQIIFVPILVLNRSKEIWGEDSMVFRPERWSNIPKAATHIPGVWSNMLTFLGGPRACIGYRFSLIEMKSLLFTLVRAFEFELAVPASEMSSKTSLVRRPALLSDPKGENQMPLYVTRYGR
ncbi:cytochrome P450 [Panaeolus papilionaceus]|nr:cytochrome P450 [Panaeolus papilionaceus]